MKTYSEIINTRTNRQIVLGGFLTVAFLSFFSINSAAIPPRSVAEAAAEDKGNAAAPVEETAVQKEKITIQRTEPADDEDPVSTAWLGVSTSEASDALASQLDLQRGVGLMVTYVGAESPAAKAGLQ